jgi:tetratricopeptide (TPR) repeat protein
MFREEIRDRVRAEAERHRPSAGGSPFAIDLNLVPQARKALAAGDPDTVSDLLGAWPGPLSMLLRTAEGQRLAPEVRATLAEALGLLGTSYVQLGRYEWAQEVLRLAIQWGQEQLEVSADLFRRLGSAYVAEGRHAEAIGLLRRALGLGAPRVEVLPVLARCFLMRERYIPAMLCAEDALAAGAKADTVKDVRAKAQAALGDPWTKFRRKVPSSSGTR